MEAVGTYSLPGTELVFLIPYTDRQLVSKYCFLSSSKPGPLALNDPPAPLVLSRLPRQTSTFHAISHLTALQVTFHMPPYRVFKRDRGSPSLKLTFPLIFIPTFLNSQKTVLCHSQKRALCLSWRSQAHAEGGLRRLGAKSPQDLEGPTKRFEFLFKTKEKNEGDKNVCIIIESIPDSIHLYANTIIKYTLK